MVSVAVVSVAVVSVPVVVSVVVSVPMVSVSVGVSVGVSVVGSGRAIIWTITWTITWTGARRGPVVRSLLLRNRLGTATRPAGRRGSGQLRRLEQHAEARHGGCRCCLFVALGRCRVGLFLDEPGANQFR